MASRELMEAHDLLVAKLEPTCEDAPDRPLSDRLIHVGCSPLYLLMPALFPIRNLPQGRTRICPNTSRSPSSNRPSIETGRRRPVEASYMPISIA